MASWKIHHLLRWFYQLETSIHGKFLIATITILSYHGLFVWGSEQLQRFFQKLEGFWQRTCGIRWSFVKALLGLASRPLKLSFVWKHTQKILQSPMLLSVPFKIAMNCGVDHPPVFFYPEKMCTWRLWSRKRLRSPNAWDPSSWQNAKLWGTKTAEALSAQVTNGWQLKRMALVPENLGKQLETTHSVPWWRTSLFLGNDPWMMGKRSTSVGTASGPRRALLAAWRAIAPTKRLQDGPWKPRTGCRTGNTGASWWPMGNIKYNVNPEDLPWVKIWAGTP